MSKDIRELQRTVFELSCLDGTPGNETQAALRAAAMLEKYMPVRIDALGSVRGATQGNGVHILLDAHIDRIGMIVTSVSDDGFIKFAKCGGTPLQAHGLPLCCHAASSWLPSDAPCPAA